VELANAGKFYAALPIYRELDPMRDLLTEVFLRPLATRNTYALASIKYWMELLGFRMGVCRPPLAPICDDATKVRIREALLSVGAIVEEDLKAA
jgi:dihydrodipicolinate synthase/N-acetylneuraminate lyase